MEKLTVQTPKDLTPEKILGFPEVKTFKYEDNERKAIALAFGELAKARNENYTRHTIENWIEEFEKIKIEPMEVVKRVRLTKFQKKFGVTDFAEFMNVNLSEYFDYYQHEKREVTKTVNVNYGFAEPLFNHFRDLQNKRYEILDELPPEEKSPEGLILIRDDRGYKVFYNKEHFKIIQG